MNPRLIAVLTSLGLAGSLIAHDPAMTPVILPMCTAVCMGALFIVSLSAAGQVTPVADIGAWYVLIGTVYTVFPLAVFLIIGGQYTPLNDNRLLALQPGPATVGRIGWMYVVHVAAFAITYRMVRGRRVPRAPVVRSVPKSTFTIAVVFWAIIAMVTLVSGLSMVSASSYVESYSAAAALPLGLRQFLRLTHGMQFILTVTILIGLFSRYERRRWLITAWLAFQVFRSLLVVGERTGLVLSFSVCVILYHVMVRPIRARTAFSLAAVGLTAFLAYGVFRTFRTLNSPEDFAVGPSGGEFESMFGNAVDLDMKVAAGEIKDLPFSFYTSDIVAAIPSQVLPFDKVDLSDWYVSRFYPSAKERGAGFAFGVVAESIIGFGWIDLVARGAILGLLFAKLHGLFRRRGERLWVTVLYIWATVWCYQAFRGTSLMLLPVFLQQFIPTVLLIECVRAVLAGAAPRRSNPAFERVSPTRA